jgi:hypothetical protein
LTRYIPIAAITILMLSSIVFAQNQPDAATLINNSIANAEQNSKAALAYTFHENYVSTTSTSAVGTGGGPQTIRGSSVASSPTSVTTANNGGGDGEWSIQYDVLFIEGIPYRRVTSLDRKPLTPESAATESTRYDSTVASIHEMSAQQRLRMLKSGNSLTIDPAQFATHYDCKIAGHQKVQKRPATVVQCKLRGDAPPPTDATPAPISKDVKLWIDDEKPFFVQTRAVLNRIDKYRKLNTLTIQWSLIDGVWHQTSTELEWVSTVGPETRGKIVDSFSDFKKFRTEATILPGYTADIPLPPTEP